MASFDFIEASTKGYEFSWNQRSYLLRAALPIILVKLVCMLAVRFMQIEEQSLIGGLVFIPAHIIEALFVISVVRFIAFREPLFDFRRVLGRGDQQGISQEKENTQKALGKLLSDAASSAGVRIFKAAVAMYLLIKTVKLVLVGVMFEYSKTLDLAAQPAQPEQNFASMLIIMAMTILILWSLRLFWLYIPVALGHSVRGFMARIQGMMISLGLFATLFVCTLPLEILVYAVFITANFILVPESALQLLVHDIIGASGRTMILVVQVAAITYGFVEVLTPHKKKK